MKRKSLLIMLLVALFVPLAMNAQTQRLRKNVTRAARPQLQLEVAGQLQTIEDFQPGMVYHRATVNTRDNVLYSNGFNSQDELSGVSIYDNDGDGNNWGWYNSQGVTGASGDYALGSQSYDNDAGALTPDNWLIMPAVTLPSGNAQYFASVYARSYGGYGETIGIFAAPENDDYMYQVGSDFNLTQDAFVLCEVDLSEYAGQTIEIYIRHYNCTDGFYLFVDDFSIYSRVTEEEITIGDGTSNTTNFPTRTNQNYSFTQQIYTATEIGHTDGGNITSVSFYSTRNSTRSLDVYMVNTTMTQFTSTSVALSPTPAASNKVFSGSVSFTANAWTKITFDTPFEYTGGNVVLIVDDNTGSSSGSSARNFRQFSTGNNNYQARYIYGTTNYAINQSSFTQRSSSKNQVKFTIQAAPTPVESITASDLSLTAGFSAPIDYTVLPADATNPAVTFTSANTSVAEVDANGVVYAIAAGSTTITLTSVSNPEVSTTINVVVEEFVGLIFDFETDPNEEGWTFVDSDGDGFNWEWEDCSETPHNTPFEGEGCLFSASYDNDNQTALNPDNWAITPAIHILNSPSVVYLYAQGQDASYAAEHFQVYIGTSPDPSSMTAISSEFVATGSYVQYSANIPDTYAGQIVYLAIRHFNVTDMFVLDVDYLVITNAELAPEGILVESITADDVEVVVGATATITNLVVLPADATNPAVTYTSNDETIATVENGVVTGVAAGTTTITIAATDGSNVSTTIDVTVNGIDVTGITAEDVEVVTGETATITYTVAPTNATDQSVTFTSANTNIATVDADGVVTGVSAGETTITIASVSNPDITAEITVTVTSNPDAVQFTVNAPAYARPGQTITVEAYMAAPTSGNYDGFTSLGVHLYYDNTVFEHTADPTYGAVGNACMLKQFSYPSDGVVRVAFVQPAGSPTTVTGLMFTMEFTVLAEAELGSYTFYVEPMDAANFTCNYNNGQPATQIPYEFTPSTVNVSNSYTKHIIGWASEEEGSNGYNYYLIASPLADDVDPSDVTNMIANTANEYDLYYFDQAGDVNGNEWINHKVVDFELENGKGYLYANKNSVDLKFTGAAPTANQIQVPLEVKDCSNASGHFEGWNLVGNPFGVTAYIDRDCYKMNAAGSEIIAGSDNSVDAMEGIFVIATTDGEEMTFSKTNSGFGSKVVMNVSDSQGLADRAIVRFGEGSQLPKFQLFGNSTKVYFPEDDQDYAVVRSANENELPVNFKASSNGNYTMSVNVEELDMDYLHLIDNMTGMDVDLLQTPSYTFEATTSDEESRFRLVFATVDSVNENSFGFVNASGNLCIYGVEGKATVQVIDVLGHVLSSETFSGSYEKHLDVVPGVYMIRLIQGNDIRVQKMVVR